MKKIIYIICILVVIGATLTFIFTRDTDGQAGLGGMSVAIRDVFGTQTGTSTTGTLFGGNFTATTSKAMHVMSDTDSVIFTIKAVNSSSTPNGIFAWNILGSNDVGCDTSTTTAGQVTNQPLVSEVNWYNADPSNSYTTGQATFTANNATGTVVTLTNLNWRCLNFEGNGSSTNMLVQLKAKELN